MTHAELMELFAGKRWMQFQIHTLDQQPKIALVGDVTSITIGKHERLAVDHTRLHEKYWNGWRSLSSKEPFLVPGPADRLLISQTPLGRLVVLSVNAHYPEESIITVFFPEGDEGTIEETELVKIYPIDLATIVIVPESASRYSPGEDPNSEEIPF